MVRIVLYAVVCLGAFNVGRSLWPALRTRRGAAVYWTASVVGFSTWMVPYVLGFSLHGPIDSVGSIFRFASAGWLVAALTLTLSGSAFLFIQAVLRRIARWRSRPAFEEKIDEGRRGVLTATGRAMPLAALAFGGGGVVSSIAPFTIRRSDVKLRGLAPELDGFRIGQITDTHVGAFIDAAYIRRAVEAMNAEQTDLQVMTGDLIDDLEQIDATFDALQQCRARHGMFAILGNHEHWRGLDVIVPKYEAITAKGGPVRLLVNESARLEHKGAAIRIVGTDYPMPGLRSSRQDVMARQAETSFAGVQPGETVLCLAHHPDFFPFAAERGARLTLSGHTHGGQVAILGFPVFGFAFRHMLGWYRSGEHRLYVSGGTGHWLPFRIGVPTEVTILTLRAA